MWEIRVRAIFDWFGLALIACINIYSLSIKEINPSNQPLHSYTCDNRLRPAWGPNLMEAPLTFACLAPRVRTAERITGRNFLRLSRETPVKPEEDLGWPDGNQPTSVLRVTQFVYSPSKPHRVTENAARLVTSLSCARVFGR